jgi:DNA-binding GntR family transcriptional regulator
MPPEASPSVPDPAGIVIRRGSGEQAASYIRQLIFTGELLPGTRLPQGEIAEALGISRIPVREAVVALEREGWVTTRFHHGAFVNSFDEDTIRDHYLLFGMVYGLACRRALIRDDPGLLLPLVEISREIARIEDPVEVGQLAVKFHSSVVEAAHSPRIRLVLRAMSALVPGPFFVLVPDAIVPERKGLAAIVRAMKKRDDNQAADAYVRTLTQQGECVVELFHRQGLLTAGAAS